MVGASRSDGLALAAAVAGEAGVPWFSLTLPAESEVRAPFPHPWPSMSPNTKALTEDIRS